jgi:transcriptional regulator with XRE-family HTH domain
MAVNRSFGPYLRERRVRLDPAEFGFTLGRRRTPGLRREEVAMRAGISTTWYSWLEQGRGGAPSADALDGIAEALQLNELEREHLFLLGLGRPPEVHYGLASSVPPKLQRVIDALEDCPALVRTATWDVVAWNPAALAVFDNYAALPPTERNLLRIHFLSPNVHRSGVEWENVGRFMVGVFRADATRAGAETTIQPMVDELCSKSSEFASMWRHSEINGSCEQLKRVRDPKLGDIVLEFSSFVVSGRSDLAMLVYTPATPTDAERVIKLIGSNKE